MKTIPLVLVAILLAGFPAAAQSGNVRIVAAENFYAEMARQIAGPDARIDGILSNPNQDPHDFEASPATARLIADASLVIYNGADYDPWMESLLKVSPSAKRRMIVAASLMNRKSGDNPHLWYDPATMPAVAKSLAAELARADPARKADYDGRLAAYLASLRTLSDKIAELHQKYGAIEVSATEPVFGYMAEALGFRMRNQSFQISVMNGTEPGASQVAAFESDLKDHKVKVLFYNSQVSGDLTRRLQRLAKESKIPVVGVSEMEPAGTDFLNWMLNQLASLDKALAGAGS